MRERLLAAERVKAIEWQNDTLRLLDQRLLPLEQRWLSLHTAEQVADAIQSMVVRGAPAIGISAAFGVVLSAQERLKQGGDWRAGVALDIQALAASRPTAVNLFWALDRMRETLGRIEDETRAVQQLLAEALFIYQSDREANLNMAQFGADIIRRNQNSPQIVLTHCNAGALATGGFGTALGVIRAAYLKGLIKTVYADETRPWLQGSRLTAWELANEGIPVRLNVDSAAAHLMKTQNITWVIVGADRITANGDVANKIGTYQLAVNAMHHGVRLMVVAPTSTIDMTLSCGEDIPIEERDGNELLDMGGHRITLPLDTYNPVFDVTPADLVDVIVTERGVVERPSAERMIELMNPKRLH